MKLSWPTAPLRSYLFAIVLLAILPLAGLTVWLGARAAQREAAQLDQALQQRAGDLARQVEQQLLADGETLGRLARGLAADPPAGLARAQALLPYGQSLFLLDADGSLVPGGDGAPAPRMEGSAPGGARLSGLLQRPLGGSAVALSVPLPASAPASAPTVARRLGVWIPASHWQALLQQGGTETLSLQDGQGQLLASAGPAASAPEDPAGATAYTAWQDVPQTTWRVRVSRPAAAFDSARRGPVWAALGGVALCLLAGAALALWLARRVTRPLHALGSGGPAPAQRVAVREIAQLQDVLGGQREQASVAGRALQQTAEEFEALFRQSPIGLAWARDAACRQVLRNDALQTLLHRSGNASSPHWRLCREGQPLALDQQPLAVAARTGQAVPPTALELRFGESEPLRFVLVQAQPLRDAQGAPRGAVAAFVDVTEQRQFERRRSEVVEREQGARRAAESASQSKDELLGMLGHELRNPLNAIASAAAVLKLLGGGGAKAEDARQVVERQTQHLARLIGDVLQMAHTAAGPHRLGHSPVDLGRLAAAHLARRPLSGPDGAQGERVALATEEVWVEGDLGLLEQVLCHLLDNALKHSPPGGTVRLVVRAEAEHAVLEVSDQGSGISAALLSRVFDLFVQRPGADAASDSGGPAVGLALVRRLVHLHGGSVRADSDGRAGHGSRFTVRLPRIEGPAAGAACEHPGRRPRRVLLVQDNPDALQGLQSALARDGHALSTATDGESGLAMLLAERPEVAVIDISLPRLTGLELARRSRGAGYAGRLIALSSDGLDDGARDALRAGFDAHLVKPVDFERLRKLLGEG